MLAASRVNHTNYLVNCLKLTPQLTSRTSVLNVADHQHIQNVGQVRGIRVWRRAHPFPFNWKQQHHIFLPNLQARMDEIESTFNPVKLVDIGMTREDFLDSIRLEERKLLASDLRSERRDKIEKARIIRETADLLDLVDIEKEHKPVKYDAYSVHWSMSNEGKQAITELAHHYQVYRDLFSSPSLVPVENIQLPKAAIPQFKPPADHENMDVIQKWFPGSQRMTKPVPRNIYYFTPHVPVHVEFAVPETRVAQENDQKTDGISDDSLLTTPVCRGNIVESVYASERPSIVIDARGINDEKLESYFDVIELDGIKLLTNKNAKKVGHYTIAMYNLDSVFGDDKPVCHWMVSNITKDGNNIVTSDEVFKFLPAYGIRGLGYLRYAFVVYHHDDPISIGKVDDFILKSRQIDPLNLGQTEDRKPKPVGLSWFQVRWDSYSQKVFHHILSKFTNGI